MTIIVLPRLHVQNFALEHQALVLESKLNSQTTITAAPATIGEAATTGFESGAIATGNLKGALQGAFSAGLFYGVGNVVQGGDFFAGGKGVDLGRWEGVALHGIAGCITSAAAGGRCSSEL